MTLRHAYASMLLAAGVSPAYVQEQLRRASIELTVGTHQRWLRKRPPGALDMLERDSNFLFRRAGAAARRGARRGAAEAARN